MYAAGIGISWSGFDLYHPGILAASGILPAALIAIVLNLVLPEELAAEATDEVSGGHAGHGAGSQPGE